MYLIAKPYITFFLLLVALMGIIPPKLFADDCKAVQVTDFPQADRPTAIDRENLIGEPSWKFYYGIGMPVDYLKARKAAFLEFETGSDQPLAGFSILLMIYANGLGVKKDLNLCIRMAECNIDGSPNTVENRVNHLKQMKWNPFLGVFDINDDIPADSGLSLKAWLKEKKTENQDITRLDSFLEIKFQDINKWPKEQRLLFEALKRAADNYFDKRMYEEVDSSGTARSDDEEEELNNLETGFLQALNHFEKGHYPKNDSSDFASSQSDLDKVYSKLISLKDFRDCGSINAVGIRVVQRRWMVYRDAWIQFAVLRYPNFPSYSVKAWLTEDRAIQLEEFLKCAK